MIGFEVAQEAGHSGRAGVVRLERHLAEARGAAVDGCRTGAGEDGEVVVIAEDRIDLDISRAGAGGQRCVILHRQRADHVDVGARGGVRAIGLDGGGRHVLGACGVHVAAEINACGRADDQPGKRRVPADKPEGYSARSHRHACRKGAVDRLEGHVAGTFAGRYLHVAGERDRRVEADVVAGRRDIGGRVDPARSRDGDGPVGVDVGVRREGQVAHDRLEVDRPAVGGGDTRDCADTTALEVIGVTEVDRSGGGRQHVDVVGRATQGVGAARALEQQLLGGDGGGLRDCAAAGQCGAGGAGVDARDPVRRSDDEAAVVAEGDVVVARVDRQRGDRVVVVECDGVSRGDPQVRGTDRAGAPGADRVTRDHRDEVRRTDGLVENHLAGGVEGLEPHFRAALGGMAVDGAVDEDAARAGDHHQGTHAGSGVDVLYDADGAAVNAGVIQDLRVARALRRSYVADGDLARSDGGVADNDVAEVRANGGQVRVGQVQRGEYAGWGAEGDRPAGRPGLEGERGTAAAGVEHRAGAASEVDLVGRDRGVAVSDQQTGLRLHEVGGGDVGGPKAGEALESRLPGRVGNCQLVGRQLLHEGHAPGLGNRDGFGGGDVLEGDVAGIRQQRNGRRRQGLADACTEDDLVGGVHLDGAGDVQPGDAGEGHGGHAGRIDETADDQVAADLSILGEVDGSRAGDDQVARDRDGAGEGDVGGVVYNQVAADDEVAAQRQRAGIHNAQVAVNRDVLLDVYRASADAVEREVRQRVLATDRAGDGDCGARRNGQVFGDRAHLTVDLALPGAEDAHMAVGGDDLPVHAIIDANAVVDLDETRAGNGIGRREIIRLARADDDEPAAALDDQGLRLEVPADARRAQSDVVLERRVRRVERVRAVVPPNNDFIETVLEEGDLVAVEVEHVRLRDGNGRRRGVIAAPVQDGKPDEYAVLDGRPGDRLKARQRNDDRGRRVVARSDVRDGKAGDDPAGVVLGCRRGLVDGRFAVFPASDERDRRSVLGVVSRSAVDQVDARHLPAQDARDSEGPLSRRRHDDQRFGGIPPAAP